MSEVAAVLRHIRTRLPDLRNTKLGPEYSYASLPLCVIDAVYSVGVRYTPTIPRTVQNWCLRQQRQWAIYRTAGSSEHSIEDFVKLLDGHDFEALARDVFSNRQRTSTSSGILKAEAVYRFARVLRDFHINVFGDTEDATLNQSVEKAIRKIPGQKSGISFSYFLMLAGSDKFVKADRMICRFVAEAIQASKTVSPAMAQSLVVEASSELKREIPGLTPRLLDYAIWTYQRQLRPARASRN